jgi:hypothetical protein
VLPNDVFFPDLIITILQIDAVMYGESCVWNKDVVVCGKQAVFLSHSLKVGFDMSSKDHVSGTNR